jgi:hypothetical protein
MYPIFRGTIKQGKITIDEERQLAQYLRGLEGKEVEMIVRQYRRQRTDPQNNYYFGVVIKIIGDYVGEDDYQAVHEALKIKFLGTERKKGLDIPKHSKTLKTHQFSEYVEKIKRWAAQEYGIYIPDAEEVAVEEEGEE